MATAPSNEVEPGDLPQSKPPFLRRVRIRNYKSIAFCDVTLEPLTILVGRNATGKSNFLDALSFLRDVVVKGALEAVKLHGGRDAVLCRATNSTTIGIEIEVNYKLQHQKHLSIGTFGIEIDIPVKSRPVTKNEHFLLEDLTNNRHLKYQVIDGILVDPTFIPQKWSYPDRTVLGSQGGTPFVELFEAIASILNYNFNVNDIRNPQLPTHGSFLDHDGRNLASAIETTRELEEWPMERVGQYLNSITNVDFKGVMDVGGYEVLRFAVQGKDNDGPMEFNAASMSDGTLRVFASLVAVFQMALPYGYPSIVGVEEPETALHPAAMRALVAALDEATLRTQVILTTHSPDLLDVSQIKPINIRVVQLHDGKTVIGPMDSGSIELVHDQLLIAAQRSSTLPE